MFRLLLIFALFTFTIQPSFSQLNPEGRYKGQICFRHCLFFKLNIKENGSFALQTKGYGSEWRTSYGFWMMADDIITLKTIDSSSGAVDVAKYIVREDGLWRYDENTGEPIEVVFKSRRPLLNNM